MKLVSKGVNKLSRFNAFIRNLQLQKKVDEARRLRESLQYNGNPQISIILQFFNKRQNIKKIIERLRLTSAEEIIVIDDGSIDGSYKEWIKYLNRPNDFLLHCNDLFEVRTYDRAIRMAKGEYICLLQDDDIPPPNNDWVEQAIKLFDAFPKLLILGGKGGLDILIPDPVEPNTPPEYKIVGDIAGCPGVNKYRIYEDPIYLDPSSGIKFMFTVFVNRAPTFLRRDAFLELGGINQEYAPFQCDDVDACIRAWLAGYQVGFYPCPFLRDVGRGGMRAFNSKIVPQQAATNWQKIYSAYSQYITNGDLQSCANSANKALIPVF